MFPEFVVDCLFEKKYLVLNYTYVQRVTNRSKVNESSMFGERRNAREEGNNRIKCKIVQRQSRSVISRGNEGRRGEGESSVSGRRRSVDNSSTVKCTESERIYFACPLREIPLREIPLRETPSRTCLCAVVISLVPRNTIIPYLCPRVRCPALIASYVPSSPTSILLPS